MIEENLLTTVDGKSFLCVECTDRPATQVLTIGVQSYSLCDRCYPVVYVRPRSLNRKGRREAAKQRRRKKDA